MVHSLKGSVHLLLEQGNIVLCSNHQGIVSVEDDTSPHPGGTSSDGTSSFKMSSKVIFLSRGLRIDPCGTPHVIFFLTMPDAVCANPTRTREQSWMILWRYTGTFAFTSASNMRVHGIKLNAFWISRLTAAPNLRFLIANAASFLSFQAASILQQPPQIPYWSALKARFLWKCFLSRSATTCLTIFPIVWRAA